VAWDAAVNRFQVGLPRRKLEVIAVPIGVSDDDG